MSLSSTPRKRSLAKRKKSSPRRKRSPTKKSKSPKNKRLKPPTTPPTSSYQSFSTHISYPTQKKHFQKFRSKKLTWKTKRQKLSTTEYATERGNVRTAAFSSLDFGTRVAKEPPVDVDGRQLHLSPAKSVQSSYKRMSSFRLRPNKWIPKDKKIGPVRLRTRLTRQGSKHTTGSWTKPKLNVVKGLTSGPTSRWPIMSSLPIQVGCCRRSRLDALSKQRRCLDSLTNRKRPSKIPVTSSFMKTLKEASSREWEMHKWITPLTDLTDRDRNEGSSSDDKKPLLVYFPIWKFCKLCIVLCLLTLSVTYIYNFVYNNCKCDIFCDEGEDIYYLVVNSWRFQTGIN